MNPRSGGQTPLVALAAGATVQAARGTLEGAKDEAAWL